MKFVTSPENSHVFTYDYLDSFDIQSYYYIEVRNNGHKIRFSWIVGVIIYSSKCNKTTASGTIYYTKTWCTTRWIF